MKGQHVVIPHSQRWCVPMESRAIEPVQRVALLARLPTTDTMAQQAGMPVARTGIIKNEEEPIEIAKVWKVDIDKVKEALKATTSS